MKTIAYICSYESQKNIFEQQLACQSADIKTFCKTHNIVLEDIFIETNPDLKPVLLNIMSTYYKKADRLIITNSDVLSKNRDFKNWVEDELYRINIEIICIHKNEEHTFFAEKAMSYLTENVKNIPSNPEVIKQAVEVMQNKNTTIKELEGIISQDIGLTARILKLVNSTYYGFPKQIATIQQALTILGFTTIKGIILSSNIYKQSVSNNSFDFNKIQNNSVLCAKIAKKLSADMPGMNYEEIYTSALLHDMGKIFFAQFDWDNYSQVYKCKNLTDSEYLKKEEDICGLNHCEIANMIAYSWNMPEIISEIATYHHKPEQSLKYSRECALIKLADMIVQNKYSNEKLNIDKKLIDVLEILNISEDNINIDWEDKQQII